MNATDGKTPCRNDEAAAKPYRVLSLDGGGMRGIYTAAFLERLVAQHAARTNGPPLDLGLGFDLITGTSTGAIVGAAAAIGVPMTEIVTLYRDHGAKIFPHRIDGKLSAIFRALTGSRYVREGDKALRKALGDVLGGITLAEVYANRGISMAIPAIRMSTHKAWVFKKTAKSGARDDHYPLADICLASSAAPIFRSLAAIDEPGSVGGGKQVFCDGGLWANNPIMVGLTDALTNAAPGQPIEIFSLGTCPRPEGEHIVGDKVHRSMLGWSLGADVGPLSISAQEFAYDNMARLLANAMSECGRSIRRVRFPNKAVPASMLPYLALDDSRVEAMDRLVQQAHTDADATRSACDDPNDGDGQLIRTMLGSLPPLDPACTLRTASSTTR